MLCRSKCGAGFSLRGTSVPLERLAATCGRRAEATPQAEACPTNVRILYSLERWILDPGCWLRPAAAPQPFLTNIQHPTSALMDPRNFQYMFYGFSAAWVLIVIYALTLLARERKIKDELTRLKSMMEDRGRK